MSLVPPLLVLAGVLAGFVVAVRYSVQTYRLQRKVREIARSEGLEWDLLGDPRRMWLFVFNPESLIDPADSGALAKAKASLLQHRRTAVREVIRAVLALVGGVSAAIGFVVAFSFLK